MSRRAPRVSVAYSGVMTLYAAIPHVISVHSSQTKPVVDYYAKQGLYSPLDANQKADTVKAAVAKILSTP